MFADKSSSFKSLLRVSGLLLCMLPGACSTSFTYNQLDWLIPWYMGSYVDLNSEQKELLKIRLDPLLSWHREEELAGYIEFLDRIEMDLKEPVAPETVRSWMSEVRQAVDRIEFRLLQLSLEMGESMNNEQIADFKTSLMDKQQEYRDEYLKRNDKDYTEDNYKRLSKNLRRFSGKLNKEQKQTLQRAAESMRRFDIPWLEDRELWLENIKELLDRKPGWQQAIVDSYRQRDENRSKEYQMTLEHNIQVLSESISEILSNLDDKQRSRFIKKIGKYKSSIEQLAKKET
ncbi:MAG: hypothetical protein GKR93_08100 [Gammaproteobacteria bacterium]|nr:hypothetical protein [Gammaproteobacteria bacterium]